MKRYIMRGWQNQSPLIDEIDVIDCLSGYITTDGQSYWSDSFLIEKNKSELIKKEIQHARKILNSRLKELNDQIKWLEALIDLENNL